MATTKRSFQAPRTWRNLQLNIPLEVGGMKMPVTLQTSISNAMQNGSLIKGHNACAKDGTLLQQRWWCDAEKAVVTDIEKVYEYGGQLVPLMDSEHPNLEQDGQVVFKSIVPVSSIDPIYYDAPYAIWPSDDVSGQTFDLILATLRSTDSALIGETVLVKTTKAVVLRYSPDLDTLVLHTCTYEARVKRSVIETVRHGYIERSNEVDGEATAAMHIALTKSLDPTWELRNVRDTYTEALEARLAEKLKTGKVTQPTKVERALESTPNLMEALKAQMAESKSEKKPRTKPKAKAKDRADERVEA